MATGEQQLEESTMPVTDHIEQAVDIEQDEFNKPIENEEKSQEITENLTEEEAATSENTEEHSPEKDTAEVDIEKSATEDEEVMTEKTRASLSKTEQKGEGVIPEKRSSIDKMADDESNVASQEAEVEKDIAVEQEVVKEIEEEVIPTPPPSLQEDEPEKVNEDAAPSTPPPAEEPAASDAGENKTEFPTVLEDDVIAEEKLEKKRVSQQYVENIQDLDVVAMQDQPSLQERRDSKTREKQIRFEEIDIATKELLDEPPQEAPPKERKPRSKEREIVDEEPAVGAEEGEVSELPTKRRSKVDRSYTERKPSVTDISFHDEQPTLRERRESKDLERKIRIRKIERKLTEELDSIPVSPTRKGSSSTRTVTSSTTTEEYSPPSRARRSDVSGDSKIPDYSPPPRRTAGGTSSGSGSSKIRRARSFKSPAEVPYYSLRDKRPESYFSMDNYYPGKFSSTPRVDTKTMNSSQKYVDDFNLNYGSGASAASPKYKPEEYSSTSLTPTTDLIKSLSTDRSPISHSSLYATDLNRYDYNYGDVNYRPSSSFVNLSPYSSPTSLYPKARNLNDSYYSYNDYRYYPYHRSYYDYSIPYYSANYHTPSSSYVRSAVDSGIDSRSSPSSFYTPRSLYTPLSFYNDLAKVRSAYKKADRIATNAENALYDRSQTVSPLLNPSPYYNNRYKSPSNGAGYTFYPYAGSPIFSPSFGV